MKHFQVLLNGKVVIDNLKTKREAKAEYCNLIMAGIADKEKDCIRLVESLTIGNTSGYTTISCWGKL